MIRVAIVGAGPKGLFAAERLAAHLTVSDAAASITVFTSCSSTPMGFSR